MNINAILESAITANQRVKSAITAFEKTHPAALNAEQRKQLIKLLSKKQYVGTAPHFNNLNRFEYVASVGQRASIDARQVFVNFAAVLDILDSAQLAADRDTNKYDFRLTNTGADLFYALGQQFK